MSGRWPRVAMLVPPRVLIGCVLAAASMAGQTAVPYKVVVAAGTASTFAALVQDVVDADVLVIGERTSTEQAAQFERHLLTSVADRRAAVSLVLGNLDGSAQEPIDHFLMGHMTFAELASETRMPSALAAARPILELALARAWPVRAARTAAAMADGRMLAEAIRSAHGLGRPTRTLVVAVVDARDLSALTQLRDAIRARTADLRVRSLVLAESTSARPTPVASTPPDYVVYTTAN